MDATAVLTDDFPVTVTWTTTATDEYDHTFTLGELREAVNTARDRRGYARHPDITDDLYLLRESWLSDYEDDGGCCVEFTRDITDNTDISLPPLAEFTVTVESAHTGETSLFIYCLHAPDLDTARTLALAHCIEEEDLGIGYGGARITPDAQAAEGDWCTFPGVPPWPADLPGRGWTDLRADADMLTRAYTPAGAR
jgi:hypothetical protein